MSILNNSNAIPVKGGGYFMTDSIRFRETASAYLRRTPSTTTNRRTLTFSCWYKKSKNDIQHPLFYTQSGGEHAVRFRDDDNSLDWFYFNGGYVYRLRTSALYRDTSSWYHIVAVLDTTNATSSERARLYVNGERITAFQTASYPALNAEYAINTTVAHDIGHFSTAYNDGYMTEVNFVDGQALAPTEFGEYSEDTGAWQPKRYGGSHGTNGFYLDMSTSGSTVLDQSANSNNWTANNMNLTTSSATTYDIMKDVPTLTDEDTANFATLNPLTNSNGATLTDGNLTWSQPSTTTAFVSSTLSLSQNYTYLEFTTTDADRFLIGVTTDAARTATSDLGAGSNEYAFQTDGDKINGGTATSYGSSVASGTTGCIAFDNVNNKIYVGSISGTTITWFNSGNPLSGTNPMFTVTAGTYFLGIQRRTSTTTVYLNFGQRPFLATNIPTGYKKLNTYNLPDSAVLDGSQYMNTVLYTGNGGTQSITGVGFSPDLVWLKNRNATYNHALNDSVRGAGKTLESSTTNSEFSYSAYFTSLNSDGFSLAGGIGQFNLSGDAYAAWNWRGSDSSPVSNTNGTITSTVSANTTSGFSVVTWTGNGANATIGHGLGAKPACYIVKSRDSATSWVVYHEGMATAPQSAYMYLETTNAVVTGSSTFWNDTIPTTTTFGVSSHGDVNASGGTYVAYVFANVEGFSKFGSYTGNGSTDGTFVYTGFSPAFVLRKVSSTTNNWWIVDSARDTYNEINKSLRANSNVVEDTTTGDTDFLSNGFKLRASNTRTNASGQTYIYMAFAENPFKNALAR